MRLAPPIMRTWDEPPRCSLDWSIEGAVVAENERTRGLGAALASEAGGACPVSDTARAEPLTSRNRSGSSSGHSSSFPAFTLAVRPTGCSAAAEHRQPEWHCSSGSAFFRPETTRASSRSATGLPLPRRPRRPGSPAAPVVTDPARPRATSAPARRGPDRSFAPLRSATCQARPRSCQQPPAGSLRRKTQRARPPLGPLRAERTRLGSLRREIRRAGPGAWRCGGPGADPPAPGCVRRPRRACGRAGAFVRRPPGKAATAAGGLAAPGQAVRRSAKG